MNVWHKTQRSIPLQGSEGDLLSVRVTVEASVLEELLETLAQSRFPINPEIQHHAEFRAGDSWVPAVHVGFPAWRNWLPELQDLLGRHLPGAVISVHSMIEEIRTQTH